MPDRLRRPILHRINADFARDVLGLNVDENGALTVRAPAAITDEPPPDADGDHTQTTRQLRRADNSYVTEDDLVAYMNRETPPTPSPESRLQLFTIRETATIIEESYHTTRNMALRGEFGELAVGTAPDGVGAGATFVKREGLLAFVNAQVAAAQHDLASYVHMREHLLGGTEVPNDATTDVTEPGEMAIDVTDEAANMSQAFQNIAGAFDAMATTVTEHHTRSEDLLSVILRETSRTRENVEDLAEVPTSTQIAQTLDAIAMRLTAIERRIPSTVITLTGGGGAGGVTHPTMPAHLQPMLTPSPLRELAELNAAPVSVIPTPDEIPVNRPDQIVEVSDHAQWTRHTLRTRRAVSVGETVYLDAHGEIRRASAGDGHAVLGVVVSVRDALPDATEIVQPLQTIEMWNNDRAEILHPWRGETAVLTTDQSGHPEIAARTDHFVIQSWEAADRGDRRRVTIQWRAF